MAQIVKNLPAMLETWLPSLGQEDPPEKGMATHSSILAWRIPWTEEACWLQSMGSARSWTRLRDFTSLNDSRVCFSLSSVLMIMYGLDSKASVYNAGDLGSIPGSGRSPGEGNGNPLLSYCLENPMDRGAW